MNPVSFFFCFRETFIFHKIITGCVQRLCPTVTCNFFPSNVAFTLSVLWNKGKHKVNVNNYEPVHNFALRISPTKLCLFLLLIV